MSILPNPLLPAGAQAVIATLLAGQRTSTCVIKRPKAAKDKTGAPDAGYDTIATVPCRVKAPDRQPMENVGGGRFAAAVDYQVHFAPSVTITSEDQITVNGTTLRVIADNDAETHGFELVVKAKAVES